MASPEPFDVGRLRLLREVAVRGTIAAAARSLGLSASAVSQQLAVLEREAGVALLDRSPRGVALTGAGHALAGRAAEVLDVLAAARADLDALAGSISGPLTLAAVASAAASFVSDAVTRLRVSQPGIVISVVAAEPTRAVASLLAGDVDVAVVDEYDYVPLALPDHLIAHEVRTEPLVTVTAHGVLPGRRRLGLADLATLDWVLPPDDAACGLAVRLACRDVGFEPRVRWQTDDMLLLSRAVAAGHGVTVLPSMAVAASGDVLIRPLPAPGLRRRLSAVTRSSAASRGIVRELIAALDAAPTGLSA